MSFIIMINKGNKNNRRGKPSSKLVSSLRKATHSDYEKLCALVVEAIINDCTNIEMSVNYLTRFEEGFPKGRIVGKEGRNDIRKINCYSLLEWLNAKGYTTIDRELLRIQKGIVTKLLNTLEGNYD
jgi:hypothetical protein